MARHRSSRNLSSSSDQDDMRLAQKDAWNALIIWIVLETLSLIILPTSPLITGTQKFSIWLSWSVPLGLIGACLIGLSSWLIKRIQEQVDRSHPNKQLMLFSSQALGWMGAIGIGLPSILVGATLLSFVSKGNKNL
jgi:Kef-type K+ transport system membrane component KefB